MYTEQSHLLINPNVWGEKMMETPKENRYMFVCMWVFVYFFLLNVTSIQSNIISKYWAWVRLTLWDNKLYNVNNSLHSHKYNQTILPYFMLLQAQKLLHFFFLLFVWKFMFLHQFFSMLFCPFFMKQICCFFSLVPLHCRWIGKL